MVCYNKLCAVDLRPVTRKTKRPQSELMLAHVYDLTPALQKLEPTLTDHSGLSGVLLSNMDGRRLLRQALDLDALTLPAPADNSIGRHNDARCAICKNVDNDAWEATDPGLVCHNCLACKQWWHLECLPEEEKETTELADPIGRCAANLRKVHRRQPLCPEPHLGARTLGNRPVPPPLGVHWVQLL